MIGKFFQKPGPELSDRVPPGQHLTKGFPVMTYGDTPQINLDQWEFKVWGLVKPLTLNWNDFMNMPQSNFTIDFHCVTHWSKLDVEWTGVKVTDFIQYIDYDPQTVYLMEHCYGGYTTNISLADFLRAENFFAHTLFGQSLPVDHGGPMRLVVPHLYAWKSAKWINGLEFLGAEEELGFWERNGYHRRGDPWTQERYSS